MSSEENLCIEINSEKCVNGFSSNASEIKGHSKTEAECREMMGSGDDNCNSK
jgi:hypothetical protein